MVVYLGRQAIYRDWHIMLFCFPIILFFNSSCIKSLFFFYSLIMLIADVICIEDYVNSYWSN